jgi:hypothetical protein
MPPSPLLVGELSDWTENLIIKIMWENLRPRLMNWLMKKRALGITDNELDKAWYMHFDGAFSRLGKGAGIVLQSPSGKISKFSYTLEFEATNNVAEYEAYSLA